jgi:hypothetical protein
MIARSFQGVTVVAGRYRLLTRIGQGGMGVVWRAHDELLRRDIAVKELHVRIGVDSDFHTKQVLREARAAAQLRHPGVVSVHDVVVDDGRPLILMELVEGQSLAELVRQHGPLPEQKVAEIGARVMEALSMAHARGVVHRDVKPANILLDGERVVLTDFGIAAITSDTTGSESVVGSLDYMAPERVNGQPVTPASDVWSLGVTLCAALRGESPFQRSDTQATLAAVLTYDPAPITHAPRLWRVLSMLLHKDPRQRPTAAAAGALLTAIAGVPRPTAEQEPPRKPANELVRAPVRDMVVPAPRTAHVVERLTDSRTGTRERAHRMGRPLAALLAVLLLIVAAGIWLVVRPPGGVAGTATASDDADAAVAALPPGFTAHSDDGFTVAIPDGWFKDPRDQDIYWVTNPNATSLAYAHLQWWGDKSAGGAYKVLADLERSQFIEPPSVSDYKRIKFVKLPAPKGTTRAELEVSYHDDIEGPINIHERIHAYVTGSGQIYVLGIGGQGNTRASAERLWRTKQKDLTAILDSFRLTS